MYYKFHVETLQLVDYDQHHTIAKRANNRSDAMMQILRDAVTRDLSIGIIEFIGQYNEAPLCNTTFRGYKP